MCKICVNLLFLFYHKKKRHLYQNAFIKINLFHMLPVILKVEYRVDVIHHDNLQREQILNFSSLVPLYKKNKKALLFAYSFRNNP